MAIFEEPSEITAMVIPQDHQFSFSSARHILAGENPWPSPKSYSARAQPISPSMVEIEQMKHIESPNQEPSNSSWSKALCFLGSNGLTHLSASQLPISL